MALGRIVALLFASIVLPQPNAPFGESDAYFIARTISASPMSPRSHVNAYLTNCSLIIDEAAAAEKKRSVLPLRPIERTLFRGRSKR
jgi:hypothetical protein